MLLLIIIILCPWTVNAGTKFTHGDCELYRQEVSKYDWDVDMVLKIAKLESGCNPKNHNLKDKHRTCFGSFNLLNVGCIHYKKGEDINNISLNVSKAYKIYKERKGFRAWTTCRKISKCS